MLGLKICTSHTLIRQETKPGRCLGRHAMPGAIVFFHPRRLGFRYTVGLFHFTSPSPYHACLYRPRNAWSPAIRPPPLSAVTPLVARLSHCHDSHFNGFVGPLMCACAILLFAMRPALFMAPLFFIIITPYPPAMLILKDIRLLPLLKRLPAKATGNILATRVQLPAAACWAGPT